MFVHETDARRTASVASERMWVFWSAIMNAIPGVRAAYYPRRRLTTGEGKGIFVRPVLFDAERTRRSAALNRMRNRSPPKRGFFCLVLRRPGEKVLRRSPIMSESSQQADLDALIERVESLEQSNEELQKENSKLRSRVDSMENRLDHYKEQTKTGQTNKNTRRLTALEGRVDSVEQSIPVSTAEADGGQSLTYGDERDASVLQNLADGDKVTTAALKKMYLSAEDIDISNSRTAERRASDLVELGPFEQAGGQTYELDYSL